MTNNELVAFEGLLQACDVNIEKEIPTGLASGNYVKKFREIRSDFHKESIVYDQWKEYVWFRDVFHEIITTDGLCYTYNMLNEQDLYTEDMNVYLRNPKESNRSDWNIFGYNKNAGYDAYPTRVIGSGSSTRVALLLIMKKKDIDYACSPYDGYKLILHTPDEVPQPNLHFHKIPLGMETQISIQPKVMTTSDDLRSYTPEDRQCYFDDEKSLRFFKHYSQENCKLECFASRFQKLWF